MNRVRSNYLRLAALSGGLAVILGAFGAHGLKPRLAPDMLAVFDTGVRYQMNHALATLGVSAASSLWTSPCTAWACGAWTVGIVVFSGSLYCLALTNIHWFGAITPIGGAAMIAGWALLFVAAGAVKKEQP